VDTSGERKVLAAGANPNIQDKDGNSSLMIAAFNGNEQAVKMLLDAGANINLKNKRGLTANDLTKPQYRNSFSRELRRRLNSGFFYRVEETTTGPRCSSASLP
jgi:ankyrin repeat protein